MAIQNVASRLPSSLSYDLYYFIQRYFGNLRTINPIRRLEAGINVINHVHEQNLPVASRTFLEVGTGHQLNLPISLWLCGASQVITVDLNPYLKSRIVFEDIAYLRENRREIVKLFGEYAEQRIFQERLNKITGWSGTDFANLLDIMNIRYLAPADAACLDLPVESIDYHISYTVLEHIPPEAIIQIFLEGKRLLRDGGLLIHHIDFSDHFSHSDKSISPINFLQFDEVEWMKYAGNRYAYHNRLCIDEFVTLLGKAGLEVISLDTRISPRAKEELQKESLALDERFRDKPIEVNATVNAWVVARPILPSNS